jgi:hypothetical protein
LDHELNAIMMLAPGNPHGKRLRNRYGKADLFAAVRSVVGTSARRGLDAYQAIRAILEGESVVQPG